ncbi:MAG: type IV toxin-antitoxin system AbiEi family antitoxin [Granulosicoccus sp.]
MNAKRGEKLNNLLGSLPSGVVLASSWLTGQGYSLDLQQQYKKNKWFESIGSGALIRAGDTVDYLGGIYALQTQLGSSVHPAAKTALSMQGRAHYLELAARSVQLFGAKEDHLPRWFKKHDWGVGLDCRLTSFLPSGLGLVDTEHKSFMIKVSSPARALMECLYMAPGRQPLMEVFELMEGLNNLRPIKVQALLEACRSVKVKRLFLYLAERAGHEWLSYVKLDAVDLGSGKRAIVSDGVYVPKYQITVPRELAAP